jgi:hypothetical protein
MFNNAPGGDTAGSFPARTAATSNAVTPEEFLRTVFGARWQDAWMAAAPTLAPKDEDEDRDMKRAMRGDRAGRYNLAETGNTNAYYSTGFVRNEAEASRKLAFWDGSPVIVLDDCIEKTGGSHAAIRSRLGQPSYVVQTSAGSYQYGYILSESITDIELYATLMRGCTLAFYSEPGADPGHEKPGQYMRLPGTINNKPKRVAENGGAPFPVRLVEWEPTRRYHPDDLKAALSNEWPEAEKSRAGTATGTGAGPRTVAEAQEYVSTDPVLAGLDKLDKVDWSHLQGGGFLRINCPWEHLHSKADDRTGYNPETRVFKCHHGAHGGEGEKKRADVEAWLANELGPAVWSDLRRQALPFTAIVPGVDVDADVDGQAPPSEPPKPGRKLRLVSLGSDAPTTPLPARRTICSFLARGEVTALLGQPATGKSAFVLATSFAIAAGRPALIGERSFRRTGDVIIVSNEDDVGVARRRREGWLRQHGIDAAKLLHRPLFVDTPGFTAAACSDRGSRVELGEDMTLLSAEIANRRSTGGDVCAVILDTMTSVFDGVPENDNGAMGRVMALLADWAGRNDVAVLLPHHMPKANGRSGGAGDMFSARGASALIGGVRLAITLTALDDKYKAKLPVAMRDRVVQIDGAKANHDAWVPRRYFLREFQDIDVVDDAGNTSRDRVPVMVPFSPKFRWDPKDDNNRLRVLSAVAATESPAVDGPSGKPLRVNGGAKVKSAADVLAEQWDENPKDIDATLKGLEGEGLLEHRRGPRNPSGNYPDVWGVSAAGHEWIKAKQAAVLTTVEDDAAPADAAADDPEGDVPSIDF